MMINTASIEVNIVNNCDCIIEKIVILFLTYLGRDRTPAMSQSLPQW